MFPVRVDDLQAESFELLPGVRMLQVPEQDDGQTLTIKRLQVALLAGGDHASVLWAGDSRAYLYRGGKLMQLSHDHSQVAELVSRGLLTPEQAEGHPAANVITRAVGVVDILELDSETLPIAEDDTILLCSDGLYRELDDDTIKTCLSLGDCRRSCDALVDADSLPDSDVDSDWLDSDWLRLLADWLSEIECEWLGSE